MNPSGYRIEEKKSADLYHQHHSSYPSTNQSMAASADVKSTTSYRSTHSSRSSVLERAREYNRRIDEQNNYRRNAATGTNRGRTKSLERGVAAAQQQQQRAAAATGEENYDNPTSSVVSGATSGSSMYDRDGSRRRSHSAGRLDGNNTSSSQLLSGNRVSTRERAMASVRRERDTFLHNANPTTPQQQQPYYSSSSQQQQHYDTAASPSTNYTASTNSSQQQHLQQPQKSSSSSHRQPNHHSQQQQQQQPPSPGTTNSYSSNSQSQPAQQQSQQQQHYRTKPAANSNNPTTSSNRTPQKSNATTNAAPSSTQHTAATTRSLSSNKSPHPYQSSSRMVGAAATTTTSRVTPAKPSQQPSHDPSNEQHQPGQQAAAQQAAVVTPELLVDALSGHEDGLLAIAEKLMEHYDRGYDIMGEAIIDAFADVQKLFQHVVEAAHMEGAAFEASRREEEITILRQQAIMMASSGGNGIGNNPDDLLMELPSNNNDPSGAGGHNNNATSPTMPPRHDEFIDQDVKDVLTEAIRKGSLLRDANKHTECYELYDRACQAASSLLPVDSDHRGRLQLSLARADSMTADRACAILRYAMDDVLRSGMRAVRTPLPDPSQRADVVLSRPMAHPSTSGPTVVVQSAEEALQSLMDELKEILSAPMYADNTSTSPLQSVAKKFWIALAEAQKVQRKNEERLEQQLGKLKGDYLLAKAEWEEKLNQANARTESFKIKYEKLKEANRSGANSGDYPYLDQQQSSRSHEDHDMSAMFSIKATPSKTGSVASFGSGLAQQAKTLVSTMNNFNCTALNERAGFASTSLDSELRDADHLQYESSSAHRRHHPQQQPPSSSYRGANSGGHGAPTQSRGRSNSATRPASRSFREYSKSPQRVDV